MKKYIKGFIKHFFNRNVSKLSLITDDSVISRKCRINRFTKIYASSISDYTYIGAKTEIVNTTIGKYCSIASGCNIGLGSHTLNYLSTNPVFTEKINGTGFSWVNKNFVNQKTSNIIIGNDVWIGARVIIISNMDTLRIGDGAVIGAGAIVTKDIPPYSIVVGVPAKIIRYRFIPEIVDKLLKICWWDLPVDVIKKNLSLFQSDNLNIELLEELSKK